MKKQLKTTLLLTLFVLINHTLSFGQLYEDGVPTFTRADTLRGTLSPLRSCYDIKHYHLDVEVFPEEKTIKGSNQFLFQAENDFQKLQFDLFDNLQVDSVIYKGSSLPYQREHNAVFVDFPKTITKSSIDSFTVYFSGVPIVAKNAPWDGGFVWGKDGNGLDFIATACQGLGASAWWPNKDHQSDEVDSMLLTVTVPDPLQNISNGKLIKTEKPNDKTTKYFWEIKNPINNYNVALNIGDYAHFQEQYQGIDGTLEIDYYPLKKNKDKLEHLKTNVITMLEAFEHWFGPYPFYQDGYKIVETPHLGMEHQSAIAYGNKYLNGYLGRDNSGTGWGKKWDFIIIHESGHEWFGNNITSKDIGDMWIHEAFTNYSEALYIEYFYGKKAGQEYIYGNRRGILNDRPLRGPLGVNYSGSGDMYLKGGVMLNQLRRIITDDTLWRNILTGLNVDFRHQTVDYDDIVDYIIAKTKMNLTPFFEQYVLHKDIPTLELKLLKDGSAEARWNSEVENFEMSIHLGVKDNEYQKINLTQEFQKLPWENIDKDKLLIDTFNYYINVNYL